MYIFDNDWKFMNSFERLFFFKQNADFSYKFDP